MSVIIFDETLNNFSRKFLITDNSHLVKSEKEFDEQYHKTINSICEQLLIYGGISFKVYGENIPLAILINIFGLKGTEELLEQGAIKFLLWNSGITYSVNDIPGVNPLQQLKLTSGVHIDPEESIASGLKFMRNPLPRKIRRDITRKVTKQYILPPEDLSNEAVNFGHEGYKNNLFEGLGLNNIKELTELNSEERKKLYTLANQCFDLALLSRYQYSTYNSFNLLELNHNELQNLKKAKSIENVVEEVFNFEKIPNFSKLISEGILNIEDIPKLRAKKESEKFRLWIDSISHLEDKDDIIREYVDAITNSKSFLQTEKGKFIRTLGVTTLGIAAGSIAGPIGLLSGATVGYLMGAGINIFDAYILDSFSKGWHPRYYIDKEIRPLIKK
ncbi:hypothetical protein CN543_18445 [Bacillus toyonensis]|uniref:hypothetical protein n=1 Tax=Bacillus toyonensis TaxID=155322 RepID=UPI000BEFD700|nr:hypothetical protein [Bacillus toyonensis]PEN34446.1 hypothetical protein CN543_18445 [Bacillus toyonensis]